MGGQYSTHCKMDKRKHIIQSPCFTSDKGRGWTRIELQNEKGLLEDCLIPITQDNPAEVKSLLARPDGGIAMAARKAPAPQWFKSDQWGYV